MVYREEQVPEVLCCAVDRIVGLATIPIFKPLSQLRHPRIVAPAEGANGMCESPQTSSRFVGFDAAPTVAQHPHPLAHPLRDR
jgi:hypothetical protein